MLFRRGRLSAAGVLAFFGALSSVTTAVAHGLAHDHPAGAANHVFSHEFSTVGEPREIEAGHGLDHAILHEGGSATRQGGTTVDMPAEERDRASSEVKSPLDRDPLRLAVFDKPPPREKFRADPPRAPPA